MLLLCFFIFWLRHCRQPLHVPSMTPLVHVGRCHVSIIIVQALLPHICQHLSVCVPVARLVSEEVTLMSVLLQNQMSPVTG